MRFHSRELSAAHILLCRLLEGTNLGAEALSLHLLKKERASETEALSLLE